LERNGDSVSLISNEVTPEGIEYVPVRARSRLGAVVVRDTTNNYSTDSPEHLQHLRSWRSQLDRCNLTAVCWRIGDENAPWNTLEKLGDEHDGQRVGEVEDEDEAVQEHETGNGRPAVPDAAGQGTSQEYTHECTKRSSSLEGRLPAGLYDILFRYWAVDAEVFLECGQGDETAHDEDAVCLHDLK
jgi:hypothetical protein